MQAIKEEPPSGVIPHRPADPKKKLVQFLRCVIHKLIRFLRPGAAGSVDLLAVAGYQQPPTSQE